MAAPEFFVSYAGADQAWAEWIADQLEDAGYATVLQVWDFRPGSDFLHQMQQATSTAQHTVAVLSPAYFGSKFGEAEWRAAFAKDPTGELGLLLPVRVRDCQPPGLLAGRVYIDLVGLNEPAAAARLRAGIQRGRARPPGKRPFPGQAMPAGRSRYPGRLPKVFGVPARNPNFTGRLALLRTLRGLLRARRPGAVVKAGARPLWREPVPGRQRPGWRAPIRQAKAPSPAPRAPAGPTTRVRVLALAVGRAV
jgi:TIR domain